MSFFPSFSSPKLEATSWKNFAEKYNGKKLTGNENFRSGKSWTDSNCNCYTRKYERPRDRCGVHEKI